MAINGALLLTSAGGGGAGGRAGAELVAPGGVGAPGNGRGTPPVLAQPPRKLPTPNTQIPRQSSRAAGDAHSADGRLAQLGIGSWTLGVAIFTLSFYRPKLL